MKPLLLRLIGAGTGAVLAALVWAAGMETCLRLTVPASSNDTIYRYTLDSKRYKVMKASASMTAWSSSSAVSAPKFSK